MSVRASCPHAVVEALVGEWRALGETCEEASDASVRSFEAKSGFRLPGVLRDLYSRSNGTLGYPGDLVRIWPVEELSLVVSMVSVADPVTNESLIIFADYSIWAHAYAFRGTDGKVFLVGGVDPILVAGSVEEFFGLCLVHSDALFPEPH